MTKNKQENKDKEQKNMQEQQKENTEKKEEKKVIIEDEEKQKLKEEVNNLKELLLRNQAELQNYKRRQQEELDRTLKYKNEDILKEFITIVDNFERAIDMETDNNFGDETSKFLEGFRLVYNQTKALLDKLR
mgnify:CR=1 FL=1